MEQPDEAIVSHLQVTFTVAEFRSIAQTPQYQRAGSFRPYDAGKEYWEHVPIYLIARCPFCGTMYEERLDTHYLGGWHQSSDIRQFAYIGKSGVKDKGLGQKDIQRYERCPHFVVVQHFVNLRSVVPKELKGFGNETEVPFVVFDLLPDDIESYVVMHSLPICRIENDQFVPRYSAYFMTYYTSKPHAVVERRTSRMIGIEDGFHFPQMSNFKTPNPNNLSETDLSYWVTKGKLQWLDIEQPELPLKAGPVEEFPYAHIEGIQTSYRYSKNKLKVYSY